MLTQIRIAQDRETPITNLHGSRFGLRYAYSRSADSIEANAPGQDYIAVNPTETRLAFALCDGVSQSFYGDLAARILGDEIVNWLWALEDNLLETTTSIQPKICDFLAGLCEPATQQIVEFALPDMLAPMLKTVLEKKRGLGSEAIFAAGMLDFDVGQLLLCWMGDVRIRFWADSGEVTDKYLSADTFLTRERWSTRRGLVGDLHIALLPLAKIERIFIYSDGLARLDQKMRTGSPGDRTLARIMEESKLLPGSDDISLLEIWKRPRKQKRRDKLPNGPSQLHVNIDDGHQRLCAKWQPVRNAVSYEVVVQSRRGWRLYSVAQPYWSEKLDSLPQSIEQIAIRAWVGEEISEWSQPWRAPARLETGLPPGVKNTPTIAETPPGSAESVPLFVDLPSAVPLRSHKSRPTRLVLIIGCLLFALIIACFTVFLMIPDIWDLIPGIEMPALNISTPIPSPTLAGAP